MLPPQPPGTVGHEQVPPSSMAQRFGDPGNISDPRTQPARCDSPGSHVAVHTEPRAARGNRTHNPPGQRGDTSGSHQAPAEAPDGRYHQPGAPQEPGAAGYGLDGLPTRPHLHEPRCAPDSNRQPLGTTSWAKHPLTATRHPTSPRPRVVHPEVQTVDRAPPAPGTSRRQAARLPVGQRPRWTRNSTSTAHTEGALPCRRPGGAWSGVGGDQPASGLWRHTGAQAWLIAPTPLEPPRAGRGFEPRLQAVFPGRSIRVLGPGAPYTFRLIARFVQEPPWSNRTSWRDPDSNRGPTGYEPAALPNCAIPLFGAGSYPTPVTVSPVCHRHSAALSYADGCSRPGRT